MCSSYVKPDKRYFMNLKQELGEKIKRLRKRNGLTQEQLSEMINISSRNLSNIEQGISFPKPETLENILVSLNTTTQELFANEHIKTKEELIQGINDYVNKIRDNGKVLEQVYKVIRDLVE